MINYTPLDFCYMYSRVTLFEKPFILEINGVPSDQKRSHEPFQPVGIVVSGPTIDPVLSLRTSDPLLV